MFIQKYLLSSYFGCRVGVGREDEDDTKLNEWMSMPLNISWQNTFISKNQDKFYRNPVWILAF